MRKLIVSMNVTLDGFMSGMNCELDWHFKSWSEDMAEAMAVELSKADTIVFGRVTYTAMARYWQSKTTELCCSREDIAFVEMMNRYTKIVFTKTLKEGAWTNSKIVDKNIGEVISGLKKQHGKNIMVYGSGKVVTELLHSGLIDEYHLWVHPVLMGIGKPLFKETVNCLNMKVVLAKTFDSGVVMLQYRNMQTA